MVTKLSCLHNLLSCCAVLCPSPDRIESDVGKLQVTLNRVRPSWLPWWDTPSHASFLSALFVPPTYVYVHVSLVERCLGLWFVGKCFVDMKEDIQRVYALYCRNHDSAIAVLEKV